MLDQYAMVYFEPKESIYDQCFKYVVLRENKFSLYGIDSNKYVFHTPNPYFDNPLVLHKELSDICKEYDIQGIISISYKIKKSC
jgi:hypothetical protein